MNKRPRSALALNCAGACLLCAMLGIASAHHSFAMYDIRKVYLLTGVVTRVDPNPNHMLLFVAPLNEAREKVLRDAHGEPVEWSVELVGAAKAASQGISVNSFPRGTIMSVGIHPLRNGFPGGGRGESGLFRYPPQTPPAPGLRCDSVRGATSYGEGELPDATDAMPEISETR